MGSFGKEHYDQLGGELVADIMNKIDFAGADFDTTVFSGEDVGHAFATLGLSHMQDLGGKIHEAVGRFESGDISLWDPEAASNVFSTYDFEQAKCLDQIDGPIGALGHAYIGALPDDDLVELLQGFSFELTGEELAEEIISLLVRESA